MKTIDEIIDEVIKAEGGYVDDPSDRGGETNFGITIAVARANGYMGPMRELPLSLARDIYRKRYVTEPGFDSVLHVSATVALELIDTGVNMGPHRAAEFLQRLLNGFNSEGRWQELFVDGNLGPISIQAFSAFIKWRGGEGSRVMVAALNGLQASRYLGIVEADKGQRKFLYGWLRARVA